VVISQGEIWWADLPIPTGSGPGFRRPVVVVQKRRITPEPNQRGGVRALTSNLKWALAPGNVSLSTRLTGLPKTRWPMSRKFFPSTRHSDRTCGKLPRPELELLFSGIDLVLGKSGGFSTARFRPGLMLPTPIQNKSSNRPSVTSFPGCCLPDL
jgi:mRNA interferase MazF